MTMQKITHLVALSVSAGLLSIALCTPAMAGGTTSRGHGIKCSWVLVSSVNGVNTYQQYCRKGV